jgi:hypothetical protein
VLVASKDPRRHQRVASRWLLRYLEEDPHATIDEVALAASSLAALTGVGHEEAAVVLRAMAERATSRRREPRRSVKVGTLERAGGVGRAAAFDPHPVCLTCRFPVYAPVYAPHAHRRHS